MTRSQLSPVWHLKTPPQTGAICEPALGGATSKPCSHPGRPSNTLDALSPTSANPGTCSLYPESSQRLHSLPSTARIPRGQGQSCIFLILLFPGCSGESDLSQLIQPLKQSAGPGGASISSRTREAHPLHVTLSGRLKKVTESQRLVSTCPFLSLYLYFSLTTLPHTFTADVAGSSWVSVFFSQCFTPLMLTLGVLLLNSVVEN